MPTALFSEAVFFHELHEFTLIILKIHFTDSVSVEKFAEVF